MDDKKEAIATRITIVLFVLILAAAAGVFAYTLKLHGCYKNSIQVTAKIDDIAIDNQSNIQVTYKYTYNGKEYGKGGDIYVICKDISPRALFYNKDLLKKYGVAEPSKTDPMNYDEVVRFLQKLTHPEDGVWGITQVN